MGASVASKYLEGDADMIVRIMMPVYYFPNAVVTPRDIEVAKTSWNLIVDDTSPEFHRRKNNDPEFTHFSCISWFFNNFYARLFDVHPLAKPLFKSGLQTQGKFLVKMVSITLSQLNNQAEFKKTMYDLTVRHSERGVKAIEFGIVGDVLFWCIKTCIGPDAFSPEVATAWVKIYSKMLEEIVPNSIKFERKGLHKSNVKRTPFTVDSTKIVPFDGPSTETTTEF